MTDDVQPIFELTKKIRILQDWAISIGRGTLGSERAIAESTGIPRSTLKSNLQMQQMSPGNQEVLARAFGFRADWAEWRDLRAIRTTSSNQRRDTAEAFGIRFLETKSKGACLTIESGAKKYVDHRFADCSFIAAGSFEPQNERNGIPLVLSLSFDRRGRSISMDGGKSVLTVRLKEADLQLVHDQPGVQIIAHNIDCQIEEEGNFRGTVEGLAAWWIISPTSADFPYLMGRRLRNDGQDCVLYNFGEGHQIRAVMTARISDCFVTVDGDPLDSDTKARFVEHLLKFSALDGTEAVLVEQTLTVVSRP